MMVPHYDPELTDVGPHGPDPRRPQPHSVTASFRSPEEIESALEKLVSAGVPRDMIDIVVSPEAAERFYPRTARAPGNDALRFAGVGGLIGLGVGSVVSLILIMLPGFFDTGIIPYVQLIGPNFVTVVGAAVGAFIGLFRRRRRNPDHARAAEEPDSIIIAVALRSRGEAERTATVLARSGGSEPRVQG